MNYQVPAAVSVRYPVVVAPESWVLPEGTVPESIYHQNAAERLKQLLDAWKARTGRNVYIARNLAIRWLVEAPTIGIDPDVCVLEPAPADPESLSSLCSWRPGYAPPPLCFEVVSAGHPHKDYSTVQDRYAALGTRELVVFDPLLAGPASLGGPVALQLWRRDALGIFERIHFDDSPAHSLVLDAWLHPNGTSLDIADDRQGLRRWLTGEERERAEKEREQAARQDLERQLAEIKAQAARA